VAAESPGFAEPDVGYADGAVYEEICEAGEGEQPGEKCGANGSLDRSVSMRAVKIWAGSRRRGKLD